VQEGLINSLRHSQAQHIDINLESRTDGESGAQRMIVTITDDGVGLPGGSWSRPGHFGLRGLTERVEHLGGELTVRNREPHGVCLSATIPLAAANIPAPVTP
jgi:two-component system sensor histidine kinase UhpB